MILLPEKFFEESAGVTLISCGGSESLGPPEGGIILAQPVDINKAVNRIIIKEKIAIANRIAMQVTNIVCFCFRL